MVLGLPEIMNWLQPQVTILRSRKKPAAMGVPQIEMDEVKGKCSTS